MKFTTAFFFAVTALAAPAPRTIPEIGGASNTDLAARQLASENGLKQGGACGDVVMIFARGSTEAGNMGVVIGPPLARAVQRRLGAKTLTVQGVDYAAAVAPNTLPGGTDAISEAEMKKMLRLANTKCPDSQILVAGYSQGAAVVHRGVEDIEPEIKSKIAAITCFGDTQFRKDKEQVPNYPKDQYKVFCGGLVRDTVCDGNLAGAVLAPHLSYGRDADDAAAFLVSKL